jgi:perosamine synthetase
MLKLIPNELWDYSPRDMIRGLRDAMSLRLTGAEQDINISGVGPCLPVRSGRAAIVVALKALGVRQGGVVAVPLYCCPVVLKAIAHAGCRARFIDVDPDTYCMSAVDLADKSSQVDVVVAVHMFGNMCDVPALRNAAPGKPLIEDCAQALESRLDGRVAGSFGDVAVFSFRSGKYISSGEGGAVCCGSFDIRSRVSELILELPAATRADELVHVTTTCLRSTLRSRPFWGLVGTHLWSAYTKNVDSISQAPIVLRKIYATDLEMVMRRMAILPMMIEKQRHNADHYLRNLIINPGMICRETPGAFFNRLQFPLLVPTPAECDRLADLLRQDQITTARPYKDITRIAIGHYGYSGDCPQAERIAKTVLVIPCHYALRAADLERITISVNRAWSKICFYSQGRRASSVGTINMVPPRTRDRDSVTHPHHSL